MSMQSPEILNQIAISNDIRRIWVDNNQWIRSLIYSIYFDLGDRQAIENRLGKTADEFGTQFAQYYGQDVGRQITNNYNNYIDTLGNFIDAYRAKNMAVAADVRVELYDVADELAVLLANLNRFWDVEEIRLLLYALLAATENEIASIAADDYVQEIIAHDQFMEDAYMLSDELSAGILRQLAIL